MKSQAKRRRQRSLLRLQVLEAVLADERRRRASASAPISSSGDVLGRGEDLDPGPARSRDALEVARAPRRPRSRGSAPGSSGLDPDAAGLAAGAAAVAAVRVEELGLAARAQLADLDLVDPGALEQPPRDLAQVEHAARRRSPRPSARERTRGPRRRPRSSRARSRVRSPRRSPDLRRAARDDPGGEPAPAAVQHRHALVRRERHRQAVGDHAPAARAPGSAVTWPSASGSRPGSANALGRGAASWRAISAPWTWRPISTRSGSRPSARREPVAVLAHVSSGSSSVSSARLRLSKGPR